MQSTPDERANPLVKGLISSQNITFDALAAQAKILGFDEAVLILSNSKSKSAKLLRSTAKTDARAMELIEETSALLLDRITKATGADAPLSSLVKSRRKGIA